MPNVLSVSVVLLVGCISAGVGLGAYTGVDVTYILIYGILYVCGWMSQVIMSHYLVTVSCGGASPSPTPPPPPTPPDLLDLWATDGKAKTLHLRMTCRGTTFPKHMQLSPELRCHVQSLLCKHCLKDIS